MGSCLIPRNVLSKETLLLTKQETLLVWGTQMESNMVREPRSAMWVAVSGFTIMGLVSSLSLASHSDSESFLVAHIAQPK